ncbi:MAG: metalloregulator ArsR/SmtB family transcription factor [Anaerolineae bacterium]|jgi:ArsR family transcriptional regulator
MNSKKRAPYKKAARRFHLLSHPARLQILDELRRGEACVCHLQAVLNRPQAYVSQQLSVLREAAVVDNRRDGLLVYYSLSDQWVEKLLEELLGSAPDPTHLADCPCPKCTSCETELSHN